MIFHLAAADTSVYLFLGLVFVIVPVLVYLSSLAVRWRKLQRDMTALEEWRERGK